MSKIVGLKGPVRSKRVDAKSHDVDATRRR